MTAFAVELAARWGHDVIDDPPAIITSTRRWTCTVCGSAVLNSSGNLYGSAIEQLCTDLTDERLLELADPDAGNCIHDPRFQRPADCPRCTARRELHTRSTTKGA